MADVTDLRERREPDHGWPQQERFVRIIDTIGDEDDHLVKTLRVLRMMVMPGGLAERDWDGILMAAEGVLGLPLPHQAAADDDT